MGNYLQPTDDLKGKYSLGQGVHRKNLEKLVAFAEDQDEDGTLIPAFLAILEMCFQSQEHSL